MLAIPVEVGQKLRWELRCLSAGVDTKFRKNDGQNSYGHALSTNLYYVYL